MWNVCSCLIMERSFRHAISVTHHPWIGYSWILDIWWIWKTFMNVDCISLLFVQNWSQSILSLLDLYFDCNTFSVDLKIIIGLWTIYFVCWGCFVDSNPGIAMTATRDINYPELLSLHILTMRTARFDISHKLVSVKPPKNHKHHSLWWHSLSLGLLQQIIHQLFN